MSVVLSEHLPLLATAPDGIRKLRGLILELAVRGKLVPQDAADEPAGELLKRIAAAKSLLEVTTGSKKLKPQPPISEDEHPFQVPDGWEWSRLADLTQVLNGRAYSKAELLDAGTPVLRVGNLFTSNHWYYSDLTLEPEKYCDAGDLIFSWSASFGPFIWQGPKVIYHYHIWKLELFDKRSFGKEFLYKFLLEKTAEIKAAGHGVSMVHMTKEKMEKIPVPVPPLAEQHRIVAKVDELMALCDRLEAEQADADAAHARIIETLLGTLTQSADADELAANWQRLAEHFDTLFTTEASIDVLKQTVLQLAVMGKLVPQNPNDEPASKLYADLINPGSEVAKSGESLLDVAMPFQLPSGWQSARLDDVTTVISGNAFKSEDFKTEGSVRAIKIANVGVGEFYESDDFLPNTFSSLFAKFCVKHGDILIALTRPYIANGLKVCRCPKSYDAALLNQRVGAIKTEKSKDISSFVYLYLTSNFALDYVIEKSRALNQPNLNIPDLRNLALPLPPLAEQYRIVAKVEELTALCDHLKADLATARQRQATLADTLIDAALEAA